MSNPMVFIQVLSWNRCATTIACMESIARSSYPRSCVVVVDNASQDDSVASIRARFPQIEVIRNSENLGYAEGNNVGIRYALDQGADFVLVLNNDIYLEPDALGHMVAAAGSGVAAVGCKVRRLDLPDRLWAAGNLGIRTGDDYPKDDGRFDDPRDLDYAVGCCILMRASVLKEIGYFDPAYFMEYEEVDWCDRARKAGYRIVYEPRAVVYHDCSNSFTDSRSPTFHYLFARNRLLFRERSEGKRSASMHIPYALRLWLGQLRVILRDKGGMPRRARAATRGIVDFFRGRFGAPPPGL